MDSYTTTSYRGLGDNLIESIKGVIVGFILFLVAFPVLWWNEGRLDMSTVAKTAKVVAADGSNPASDGTLISVTAKLASDEKLSDPDFLPEKGDYLRLSRSVEMFAWVEHKSTREEKKLGGGTKVITTYDYKKEWTENPRDSSDFQIPDGHENPKPTVENEHWTAAGGSVGAYHFPTGNIELPSEKPVRPGYVFKGKGTLQDPKLGDHRITLRAIAAGQLVTAYGAANGKEIASFPVKDEHFYRVVTGTHEEAIAELHGEHVTTTWILRLVGFLMMWFGLMLVLGPINAVLDIVPFIGSTSRFLTGLAMFPVALALSIVTILVAIVAHNPYLLIGVILALVAGTIVLIVRRSSQKKAAAGAASAAR